MGHSLTMVPKVRISACIYLNTGLTHVVHGVALKIYNAHVKGNEVISDKEKQYNQYLFLQTDFGKAGQV